MPLEHAHVTATSSAGQLPLPRYGGLSAPKESPVGFPSCLDVPPADLRRFILYFQTGVAYSVTPICQHFRSCPERNDEYDVRIHSFIGSF